MRRCLVLAQKSFGHTYPNPMVGAVVVKDGKIIGEGWHQKAGDAHAEVNALAKLSPKELNGATLYVNLEPCSHHGKTPPCCDLVLAKGIKKVIIGATDPNPKVAGRGIAALKAAGVKVVSGILEDDCLELNKRFYCFHTKRRPYIILKWAQSADGYMAPADDKKGEVFWISDADSQQLAHRWRAEEHAILVGRKTVDNDNPQLTTRKWTGSNPIRLVIDPNNSIDENAHILNGAAKTVVFNNSINKKEANVNWVAIAKTEMIKGCPEVGVPLMKFNPSWLKGGAATIDGFLTINLWDECRVLEAGKSVGNGIKAPLLPEGKKASKKIVGDILQIIVNERP
jgi:diaminohydroxyphosphoribosylaminopyrimidine deaminase/5-amino-6-(5-phosphoribosylamino)uracil reductase